jgi:hypothetical protein
MSSNNNSISYSNNNSVSNNNNSVNVNNNNNSVNVNNNNNNSINIYHSLPTHLLRGGSLYSTDESSSTQLFTLSQDESEEN